jgi:GNAT superfamily N-acetyltransferase
MERFPVRRAGLDDIARIRSLIELSVRRLGAQDYSAAQLEAALRGAFGVDSQLLRDQTYFLALDGELAVGAGGWSYRKTLFGGDARADRDPGALDPAIDAARIRAFFVHPDYARRGIASTLLRLCEEDARGRGFTRFELMATLPGQRFYRERGYLAAEPLHWKMDGGETIAFVPMRK